MCRWAVSYCIIGTLWYIKLAPIQNWLSKKEKKKSFFCKGETKPELQQTVQMTFLAGGEVERSILPLLIFLYVRQGKVCNIQIFKKTVPLIGTILHLRPLKGAFEGWLRHITAIEGHSKCSLLLADVKCALQLHWARKKKIPECFAFNCCCLSFLSQIYWQNTTVSW